MAKRYDPIMCMMVDEPDKTQDANKYVEQAIKWMKEGKGRLEIIAGLNQMGLTPSDVANYYAEAMLATGYKAKDVKAKDGAYGTVLDYYNQMKGKSKSEVEKILASAEGNPNAYLAYKEWKKRYAKAKDSNAIDKAIKTCDAASGDAMKQIASAK